MRILVIPDGQIKPDVPTDHLADIGRYIADKRPDVIVNIGDFADMPSLSSYDKGKRSFEGRRYRADIDSVKRGMDILMGPVVKTTGYDPRLIMTLGNHEERINRATELQPEYHGLISIDDLCYEDYGWEVNEFLKVVVVNGVAFSHYFASGPMLRPIGSAKALLTKKHMSCVAGHQQTFDSANAVRADGVMLTAVIAGASYQHKESYLGPQGNKHFRGILMLNDVRKGGEFELMAVSLNHLKKRK